MNSIADILLFKFPTMKWIVGETYDSLLWEQDNLVPQPSQDKLIEFDKEYTEYLIKNAYKELRRNEYPPESQLVVALWERVIEKRPEMSDELQLLRQEIKNKYPKGGN